MVQNGTKTSEMSKSIRKHPTCPKILLFLLQSPSCKNSAAAPQPPAEEAGEQLDAAQRKAMAGKVKALKKKIDTIERTAPEGPGAGADAPERREPEAQSQEVARLSAALARQQQLLALLVDRVATPGPNSAQRARSSGKFGLPSASPMTHFPLPSPSRRADSLPVQWVCRRAELVF